jgi:hypothetical protein
MENERQGQVLNEGVYQARVAEMRVGQTGWDDTWELFIKFEDMNGQGQVSTWDSLETEIGRDIAAQHVRPLGYDGKLTGLKQAVESGMFDDLVCEIKVKDNVKETKTYKIVYVNRLFGKLEDAVATGAKTADDDVPF